MGFSVGNGGHFRTGLGDIKAYPDVGGLTVVPLSGPDLMVFAHSSTPGGGTVTFTGGAGSLQLSATNLDIGPINGIGNYVGTTNQSMSSISAGDVHVTASGSIARKSRICRPAIFERTMT